MNLPLSFNNRVFSDLRGIIAFYELENGPSLADEFHAELISMLDQVLENPKGFHYFELDLRRVNLKRFPYHFLYRINPTSVRILVLRHNSRHPDYGTQRI